MLAPSIAFVDLETTGANPAVDRITEIAIVKVSGGRLDYEWSQLVDPEVPIPPLIQSFTGISDAMVRGAPVFSRIADDVRSRLEGCLFVAHNARFDFGFLKNEFKRLGETWTARVLCTVKLARALYPQHHRHGLDALIARHDLQCSARHRALGDAQVLWDFVQLVERSHAADVIGQAVVRAMKPASVPPGVPADVLDGLPDAPGVYLFYGAASENAQARSAATDNGAEVPLYVGKSINIRTRVLAHFNSDHRAGRQMELAQAVRRVECIETAGEFGALLAEARLIKSLRPLHNRMLRAQGELCALRLTPDSLKCALEIVCFADAGIDELPALHGPFKTRRDAQHMLRELAAAYKLCLRRLGLESGKGGKGGACFGVQIKHCEGVCCGRESIEEHDARLAGALAALRLKRWPYAGRIALREHDAERERTEFHVFESWCHLGSAKSEPELHELATARVEPHFDLDTYRILVKQFEHMPRGLSVVELPAAQVED
jgi:DNA polymerase-3 subunit epsilon